MNRPRAVEVTLASLAILVLALAASIASPPPPTVEEKPGSSPLPPGAAEPALDKAEGEPSGWTTAVDPKPLSKHALAGLKWIVEHQHENGGWKQGEESSNMRSNTGAGHSQANVGDTAAATLALIRSGSTPSEGPYAESIRMGLNFIMGKIEASGPSSLSVTDVQGTRLQSKLGPHIDTFLASMVLTEAKDHMPDQDSEDRLAAALDKLIHKITVNQAANGLWGNRGWAPALANSLAVKGLNRARQAGIAVDQAVLTKAEKNARDQVAGGSIFGDPGAAGVDLYSGAFNLSTLQDSVNSNRQEQEAVQELAENAPTPEQREKAKQTLVRFAQTEQAQLRAQATIIERLDDQQFMSGFGSNGGEEFLSYMNIGESVVVKGGQPWQEWDNTMTTNMNRIQNADGSWTGHHCITGRTFCTAAALMVLMVDRTPVPVEALATE